MGSYVPTTAAEREEMLAAIGVDSLEGLYKAVPQEMLLRSGGLNIPEGLSELEVREAVTAMAEKNKVFKTVLRGAGAYRHFIPSVVKSVTSREELLTCYTPYQAEISQGVLQGTFEFQTMICELTGMDVSNASHYDGATAAAETIPMCKDRKRTKAYVSACAHPQVIEVMKTYCFASNTELFVVPAKDGKTDLDALKEALGDDAACFYLQQPNYFGQIEDAKAAGEIVHAAGAKFVMDVNPDHLRINKPTGRELGQLEEAALRLKDLPFYLDYTVGATVEQIRAKVLLQCRLGKCDLVVVDYLHLLGGDRRKGETQEQMVGRNVRALKQLALDSNCPVLTVSQMNRACEARADKAYLPVMSDLRDSGTIEQVADCVAFIYRPERYGFTRDEKTGHSLVGVGKIYIAKNRNGSTGIARFRYNPSFTRITDYIQPGTQTSLGL